MNLPLGTTSPFPNIFPTIRYPRGSWIKLTLRVLLGSPLVLVQSPCSTPLLSGVFMFLAEKSTPPRTKACLFSKNESVYHKTYGGWKSNKSIQKHHMFSRNGQVNAKYMFAILHHSMGESWWLWQKLTSGKHLHNYEKSPFQMGKSL